MQTIKIIPDSGAYAQEVAVDVCVAETKNSYAESVEIGSSSVVVFDLFLVVMLRTVKLDDQFCLMAVKIRNVAANDLLPSETGSAEAKAIIP